MVYRLARKAVYLWPAFHQNIILGGEYMKPYLKQGLALLLASSLAFSLGACNGRDSQPANSAPAASQSSTASQGSSLPIVADKLTLKFVCYNWGDAQYGNQMPVFEELEKKTNIHLTGSCFLQTTILLS